MVAGVGNDAVDDVINDLQRGRLYQPRDRPGQPAAPRRAVVEVWAAAVRYLENPMRGPLGEWDSRWGGLSSWFYGARISLFLGVIRWLFLLRVPVLCAAVVVTATKAPATRLDLPGAGSTPARWALVALLVVSVAALCSDHLLRLLPASLGSSIKAFNVGALITVVLGLGWPVALLVFSAASPVSWLDLPELGTAWCRWVPALAVLTSAVVLSSHATARRMMPASLLAALCAVSLVAGWSWSGWPGPPAERGPLAGWVELAAGAALICVGLGAWRYQERFFYQVARRRVPRVQPSPALVTRLNQAVRFERRDTPITDIIAGAGAVPAHASEPGAHQHPFIVKMDSPDRVTVTYRDYSAFDSKTESRPVSQPPSVVRARPPAAAPEQLHCHPYAPGRGSSPWYGDQRPPLDRTHAPKRVVLQELWLCDEGDAVQAGDPIAVSATTRRERSFRPWVTLEWTFASRDGIVVQLTPRTRSIDDHPGTALIRPTTYPYGPVPALPPTTSTSRAAAR